MQLAIGQTIRKLRKQHNMTQDELADAAGVTVAAVSKWESGKSYPDITLLPALARQLKTSVDHLLGYVSELSQEELDRITHECAAVFDTDSFDQGYVLCTHYLQQYPDDIGLKLHIGTLLPMYTRSLPQDKAAEYLDIALELCKPAAASIDPVLHTLATRMLATICLMSERLDLAEEYTRACLDGVDGDVDLTLAVILLKKGEVEQAQQIYQRCLFGGLNDCLGALTGLQGIASRKQQDALYLKYQHAILQLTHLFDLQDQPGFHMNTYLSLTHFHAQKQQHDEMLDALQGYVNCVMNWKQNLDLSQNDFFHNIDGHDGSLEFGSTMKAAILETASQLRAYDFIQGEERFEALLSRLENYDTHDR